MDDQRTDYDGSEGLNAINEDWPKPALNIIAWNGVKSYITGIAAVLAAVYVLPASQLSLFLYLGGTAMFVVANVIVIVAAMAMELVAAWNSTWELNRNTTLLAVAVVAMAIWLSLVLYVWP